MRRLISNLLAGLAKLCLHGARVSSGGMIDGMIGRHVRACKYGENGWQTPAGLFTCDTNDPLALDHFTLLEGNPGFVNWCDVDRLLQTLSHISSAFEEYRYLMFPWIAVGVKHGNPCGAALAHKEETLWKMLSGDPLAIFGGVIVTNFPIGVAEARILRRRGVDGKRVLSGIIAPSISDEAQKELHRKDERCFMLVNQELALPNLLDRSTRFRQVRGGFLHQPNYTFVLDMKDHELCSPDDAMLYANLQRDMLLAWAVGSTSNSNTITIVKDGLVIGNGVGQQDRVGAANLAVERAERSGHDLEGSVAYSDSFFPFPDGPQVLAEAGVKLLLATSGSVKDEEVKAACREMGIRLFLIPDKKARGFFGH